MRSGVARHASRRVARHLPFNHDDMTRVTREARFNDWTGGRQLASLGTNDGARPIAFQSWHRFKEAFPPELIARAVSSSTIEVERCLDPFGGSGTTALACQMLGISAHTVEINPFLADVIRSKLHRYDIDELIGDLAIVRRTARLNAVDPHEFFSQTPPSFIEKAQCERWIFDIGVATRLGTILDAIAHLSAGPSRRFFRVMLGGMLAEVSNVVVSGKGRRYRQGWQFKSLPSERVDVLFAKRCQEAILEIQRFAGRPNVQSLVENADSREAIIPGSFDLSVFSPPYPNSFDYTDVYNLELWMLGYLQQSTDNRLLRNGTLTSHVQLLRKYDAPPSGSALLTSAHARLHDSRHDLWSVWLPDMVGAYFADLSKVIARTWEHLAPSAQCWIVVGDSQYADVHIPVAHILEEIAAFNNWPVQHVEPIRHMRSSPQQGWKPQLSETLVVLQKPTD